MTKGRCPSCDKYERRSHNYRRSCGLEFKPGHVKIVPIAEGYFIDEIICGFCGKVRDVCNGAH
jgi:hypothetical protein